MRKSHVTSRDISMSQKKKLPLREWVKRKQELEALERARRTTLQELHGQNTILQNLLRHARQEAGLTQAQVARVFGRDQTFVGKIETGVRSASFAEVEKLAKIYGKLLSDFTTLPAAPRVKHYRPRT
jgi:ribosome-binding protein aMBF1 (putative translation factor)